MKRPLIGISKYRSTSQLFQHATAQQYRMYLTGSPDRHKRTEVVLPYLAKRGELVVLVHEGEYVYLARRYCKGTHFIDLVEHGLMTTECLIRFWRGDMTGSIVPSREFHGLGSIPDGGVMYSQSILLYEATTADNFLRHKVETKIALYGRNLPDIESHCDRKVVLVFVIDAAPEQVKAVSDKYDDDYLYFVNYQTFKDTPIGQSLSAAVYYHGGERYPLRHV